VHTRSRLRRNAVARLLEPRAARLRDNPKVERKEDQKKRQCHGRNNFSEIVSAAPEEK
jgi:hypothetical protein